MTTTLHPNVIGAFRDALTSSFWFKRTLRLWIEDRFRTVRGAVEIASLLDSSSDVTKRQVVEEFIAHLCTISESVDPILLPAIVDLAQESDFAELDENGSDEAIESAARSAIRLRTALVQNGPPSGRVARHPTSSLPSAPGRLPSDVLRAEFSRLSLLEPRQRGLAFERWIVDVLTDAGVDATYGFAQPGEQIDGYFSLDGSHWVIEAKWEAQAASPPQLANFAAKVARRPGVWGLFVSMAGFTSNVNDLYSRRGNQLLGLATRDVLSIANGTSGVLEVLRGRIVQAAMTGVFCPEVA